MKSKQISTKQFVCIQFLVAMAVKMFMLPALILRTVGKEGYLVMAIYIALEFVDLTLLLFLARRNPDKTIYQIFEEGLGKIASRIIFLLVTGFFIIKALLVISEVKIFFNTIMYRDVNWAIMLVPLLAVMSAFAIRPLRTIGRVAEILTPVVLISTVVLSVLLFGGIEIEPLLPFLGEGFEPVAKGIEYFPMWFGDVTVLTLFLGKIKINKGFVLGAYISKLIATVLVMLFTIVLFSAYGNVSTLIDYGNNVSNMTQLTLGTQDYGRFDLLFYCVWLFSVFIKLGMIFAFAVKNMRFIVGKGSKEIYAIILSVLIYIVSVFVFSNEESAYLFAVSWVKYLFFPPAFLLPLVTFIVSIIKYKPNYHKIEEKKNE